MIKSTRSILGNIISYIFLEINNIQIRLGSKIEEIRKTKGISLEELSKLMGISKSTLADYEANEDGKMSNIVKIANALQVTIGELAEENFVQINHANGNFQIQFNINAKDSQDV